MKAPAQARPAGSRRGAARLAATQALYQIDLAGGNPELIIAEFISHRLGREIEGDRYIRADSDWFADVVRGAHARQAELDAAIDEVLEKERTVARLEAILRAIARAGAYEIMVRTDVPPRVAINEYVEVARAFFSGTEPTLVNGILDRLAQRYRPEDLKQG
jgi:N utilization substance protein B